MMVVECFIFIIFFFLNKNSMLVVMFCLRHIVPSLIYSAYSFCNRRMHLHITKIWFCKYFNLYFALKLRQLFFERLNVGLNFSQRKISILKNKLIVRYITKLIIASICNPNVIQGSI